MKKGYKSASVSNEGHQREDEEGDGSAVVPLIVAIVSCAAIVLVAAYRNGRLTQRPTS